MFDDPAELRALLGEMVATTAGLIDKLERGCEIRSAVSADVAHELKGLARTVGAHQLGTLSEHAEQLARGGRWDELRRLTAQLRSAQRQVADAAAALGDNITGTE